MLRFQKKERQEGGPLRGRVSVMRLISLAVLVGAIGVALSRWAYEQSGRTPAEPVLAGQWSDADFQASRLSGADPELLKQVEDGTRARKASERDVWFHLLGILDATPQEEIEQRSLGPVGYLSLDAQSDVYRGTIVGQRGQARRVHRLETRPNKLGIEQVYEVYFSPDDRPDYPILIYCLDVPSNFPSGMEIDEPIEVTGVYYKRTGYYGAQDFQTAPTILAKEITWFGTPETKGEATGWAISGLDWRGYAVLGLLAAVVAGAVVYILWSRVPGEKKDLPDKIEPITEVPSEEEQEEGGSDQDA